MTKVFVVSSNWMSSMLLRDSVANHVLALSPSCSMAKAGKMSRRGWAFVLILRRDHCNLSEFIKVFVGTCRVNTEEELGSIRVGLLHQEVWASAALEKSLGNF